MFKLSRFMIVSGFLMLISSIVTFFYGLDGNSLFVNTPFVYALIVVGPILLLQWSSMMEVRAVEELLDEKVI